MFEFCRTSHSLIIVCFLQVNQYVDLLISRRHLFNYMLVMLSVQDLPVLKLLCCFSKLLYSFSIELFYLSKLLSCSSLYLLPRFFRNYLDPS